MYVVDGAIRRATFAELDAATLYRLLALRVDVFVVEQRCAYGDLDGLDLLPTTRHLWIADGEAIVAYLRTLAPSGQPVRIGRVVTAAAWRGRGAAARLVRAAMADVDGPVVLDAQTHLQAWYERLGFVVCGARYVEHGIAHVPMLVETVRSTPPTSSTTDRRGTA